MFSKRSGPSSHQEGEMDNTKQELHQKMMDSSIPGNIPDPVLAELSTREILEALDILDRVNNSPNKNVIDDLSEKEVKCSMR